MYGMNGNPAQSMGAQGYGSLTQFASNPQDIRNQIQQDLQGYNQGYSQGFNQGYSQGYTGGAPYNNALVGGGGYGGSTLSQFGTHPQGIQQQIQQDLQSARAYHAQWAAQNGVNPQTVQTSTYGSPMSGYPQQGGYAGPGPTGVSTLSQYGSNPQTIQAQIQQVPNNSQGYAQQGYVQQNYGMNFTGPTPQYSNYGVGTGVSTLAQYGSNPQQIRQQIQQDGTNWQGQGVGGGNPSPGMGGSTLGQYGTHPQMVQSQIQQDLNGQQGYGMGGIMNQQSAMGISPQGNTLSQFGTQPQMVQGQIRQDMGQNYQ